jgi:hypothetical protein
MDDNMVEHTANGKSSSTSKFFSSSYDAKLNLPGLPATAQSS